MLPQVFSLFFLTRKLILFLTIDLEVKVFCHYLKINLSGLYLTVTFFGYISHVCKRVGRSVCVIKKLPGYLPQNLSISLSYNIEYPHMIFAIEVWASSSQTQLIRPTRLLDK